MKQYLPVSATNRESPRSKAVINFDDLKLGIVVLLIFYDGQLLDEV